MKIRRFLTVLFCLYVLPTWLLAQSDGYQWVNNRHRNPTKGGWVSNGAYVEEGVFIAPSARVEGSATVTGQARIYGNAVVRGQATVEGKARIYGNAVIEGNAMVGDEAQVFDHARIGGDAFIGGKARVGGYSRIRTGQITDGFHRPPRPAAEVEAERQAQQLAVQREAATRHRREVIAALDRAISAVNRGRSKVDKSYWVWRANNHRYTTTTRYSHSPNLVRSGDRLTFKVETRSRTSDSSGSSARRDHWSAVATGTVALRDITTNAVQQDRTSAYDHKPPQYFRILLSMPKGSVRIHHESKEYGPSDSSPYGVEIENDSKAPLEALKQAIDAYKALPAN